MAFIRLEDSFVSTCGTDFLYSPSMATPPTCYDRNTQCNGPPGPSGANMNTSGDPIAIYSAGDKIW